MENFEELSTRLQNELDLQNLQLRQINITENLYEETGDIGSLIEFWENIWLNGGLKFRGSKWAFRLADLYIKTQQYEKAFAAVLRIDDELYGEKKTGYIERIASLAKKKGIRLKNMTCPNCGSENVTITMQQVSSKTKKSGVGFGGHMNNAARGLTAMCTLGLSNLVWKKSTGTAKEVVKNQKICLCQNCGNSWTIK